MLGTQQVAVFRIKSSDTDKLFAVSNYDPFSNANVISRGIVGSLSEKTVVASPIYKQHFCLETGQCLGDESVTLKTWEVKLEGEDISIFDTEAVAA